MLFFVSILGCRGYGSCIQKHGILGKRFELLSWAFNIGRTGMTSICVESAEGRVYSCLFP